MQITLWDNRAEQAVPVRPLFGQPDLRKQGEAFVTHEGADYKFELLSSYSYIYWYSVQLKGHAVKSSDPSLGVKTVSCGFLSKPFDTGQ